MMTIETNQADTRVTYELTASDAKLANALRAASNGSIVAQLDRHGLRLRADAMVAFVDANLDMSYSVAAAIWTSLRKGDILRVAPGAKLELVRAGVANELNQLPCSDMAAADLLAMARTCMAATFIPTEIIAIAAKSSTDGSRGYFNSVQIDTNGGVWSTDGARMSTYHCEHLIDVESLGDYCQVPSALAKALASQGDYLTLSKAGDRWLLTNSDVIIDLPKAEEAGPALGRIMRAKYDPNTLEWAISGNQALKLAKALRAAVRGVVGTKDKLHAELTLEGVDLVNAIAGVGVVGQIPVDGLAVAERVAVDPTFLADLLETMATGCGSDLIRISQQATGSAIRAKRYDDRGQLIAYYLMPIKVS
jgi:hypothetical protein